MTGEEERKARNCEKQKRWARNNPEKHRAMVRRWKQDNPEKVREMRRKSHAIRGASLREQAIELLGGQCVQCHCKDIRCLQIDHITPLKGERRLITITFYSSIVQGKRENLQILCANCHAIKTYYENGAGSEL
jgi:5-methylcytosine-specific restriction endonuclease McrA